MTTPTPRSYRLLSAGNVAAVTVAVAGLTVVAVWLLGLGQHRTLFANSLLSTTILFGAFWLFLVAGLYHGVKLRDDVGLVTDRISGRYFPPDVGNLNLGNIDIPEAHGIGGFLVALVMWLFVTALAVLAIWLVAALLWAGILCFAALLYWVFFRALRLVFKNANRCRGNWAASLRTGFQYACLYTAWVYVVILAAHYVG